MNLLTCACGVVLPALSPRGRNYKNRRGQTRVGKRRCQPGAGEWPRARSPWPRSCALWSNEGSRVSKRVPQHTMSLHTPLSTHEAACSFSNSCMFSLRCPISSDDKTQQKYSNAGHLHERGTAKLGNVGEGSTQFLLVSSQTLFGSRAPPSLPSIEQSQ